MDTNNMKHLDFIRPVAEEDLRYVNIKDRQYGGSWKRRGGVGAFMMLARKWDRLENMLSKNMEFAGAYDIFDWIKRAPSGEDGTILAEVRDLRRYLLLVEAEMMARGVVPVPLISSWGSGGNGAASSGGGCAGGNGAGGTTISTQRPATKELDQYGVPVISEGKIYERGRAPRWLVRDKMSDVLDVGDPVTAAIDDLEVQDAVVIALHQNNMAVVKFEIGGGQYMARGDQLRHDKTRERVAVTNTQRTPEDGAQHAALAPWVVSPGYAVRKDIDEELFNKFWQRRAPEVYVLESHVVSHNAPRVLRDFYNLRGDHWAIRLEKCPADARDYYPKLTRELNMKEHNDLPEWQRPLYTRDDKGMKFVLAEINDAWAGEIA